MYSLARQCAQTDEPIDVEAFFDREGTVLPHSFRLPGYGEIRVDKILGKQNASSFKTRGVGERYKIRASGVTSYLFRIGDLWYIGRLSDDMRIPGIHTPYTGAYHGGQKLIDGRYDNPYKTAVDVAAICHADGSVIPRAFCWTDGILYEIDRVTGWQQSVTLRAGIMGLRYSVRTRGKDTFLYRDDDRWFMENRDTDHARVLDVHGRPVG